MTNGNSAAEVSDDAGLQRIYHAWQNSEDTVPDLLHAIYNYGYQRALSVCADGGKGEAVAFADWELIRVKNLAELVNALDRADRKGYMPDAIADSWEAFQYITVDAAPQAECAPRADAEPVCYCDRNPHDEDCPVTGYVRSMLKESGECARADAEKDAALTDEQIIAIATEHTEMVEDGEGSWPNVDWIGFARAILAARKEPQP